MPRRTSRNLRVSVSAEALTHLGGLYLLQQFFKRLEFRKLLQHYVRFPQRNNRYTVAESLLALIYPIILGLDRIETTHILSRNGVFQYLTGLPAYPNPYTLRRFLYRMAPLALPKLRTLAALGSFHQTRVCDRSPAVPAVWVSPCGSAPSLTSRRSGAPSQLSLHQWFRTYNLPWIPTDFCVDTTWELTIIPPQLSRGKRNNG